MRYSLLFALIWCALSQPLCAESSGSWLRNGWKPQADLHTGGASAFRDEREHWLRSRLRFSGKTDLNSDGLNGAIGVSADSLIGSSDAAGFYYQDAVSYKNRSDVDASSFHYRVPAGASQLTVETGRSHYSHAVVSNDRRYNASGDSSVVGFGASRPLFSRFGLAFDGIARHTGRDSRALEEGSLVSQSQYDLSSVGINAQGGHQLWGGLQANTGFQVVSGREYSETDYRLQEDVGREDEFYKLTLSGSLEQEIYHWRWRINGRYQFADEDLPVSEYLTVAAPSMMAGFNGQTVSAAQGGWLRMDTASPFWRVPLISGVLSSLNVAVLYGWVPNSKMQSDRFGRACAGQVSLKLKGRAFTAGVSVGRMIRASNVAMTMPERPDFRFSLSVGI